ncbi:hypothetical protein FHS29_006594 [Saccharothrix tamanrassetensis]|uniref:Uncharacterized protein n=1 Tax=Saccharothrix tamanrassetensis TaxID=1051531 RepID=A0A841CNE1_9PSEU|nr:hypothetical protein [Saccharothrix tamanrassetensis]MBB5959972.1 hypothetical protein [Saccharothrix tamanrassetensis]
MTDQKNIPGDAELLESGQSESGQSESGQPETGQSAPEQLEPEENVLPNRRERRGHGGKNSGVSKNPGRPHQADFVGRRVFRRTGG